MKEARRLKNIVKKKEQRQRRKERKLEASRKAKEDAERQRLIDDNTSVEELRQLSICLLYTSPSPRDKRQSRMPSSA